MDVQLIKGKFTEVLPRVKHTLNPSSCIPSSTLSRIFPLIDNAMFEIQDLTEVSNINVSELLFCHRKIVFQRINPVAQTDTYQSSYGKSFHLAIQSILTRYPEELEIEKKVIYNCSNFYDKSNIRSTIFVVGKIDLYDRKTQVPLEFKFPTSNEEITEPKSYHLQQLKYYMTMQNSAYGVLLYFPPDHDMQLEVISAFLVSMNDEELYTEHKKLISNALAVHKAIASRDPTQASHVAYDRSLSWLCKTCPYSDKCLSTRIQHNGFSNMAKTK